MGHLLFTDRRNRSCELLAPQGSECARKRHMNEHLRSEAQAGRGPERPRRDARAGGAASRRVDRGALGKRQRSREHPCPSQARPQACRCWWGAHGPRRHKRADRHDQRCAGRARWPPGTSRADPILALFKGKVRTKARMQSTGHDRVMRNADRPGVACAASEPEAPA